MFAGKHRILRRAGIAFLTLATGLALAPAVQAQEEFQITGFGGSATVGGERATQAGAHPDLETEFTLSRDEGSDGSVRQRENIRDVRVTLPHGLVGDPTAAPQCPGERLSAPGAIRGACPPESQVGVVAVEAAFGQAGAFGSQEGLFNVVPPPGVTARFGFVVLGVVVYLDAVVTVDEGYRVEVNSPDTSQGIAILGVKARFWGVPADSSHVGERLPCLNASPGLPPAGSCPVTLSRRPFITGPTRCTQTPLVTRLRLNTWQQPGRFLTASFDHDYDGQPFVVDGCDDVPFEPTVGLRAETRSPDAPTGLDVDLAVPQSDDPDGIATGHLDDVTIAFPEGLTINPASAGGLSACSDEQLGLGNDLPAACPESSKVGTVTAHTPLLSETLEGGLYVRTQASDDPESGDLFRVGLVVENAERGVLVKLGGNLIVDEDTGRMRAVFRDNPQMPVSDIEVSLKSGPRAPLATPVGCGLQTARAELTSWSGRSVDRAPGFPVDCTPGLGGFAPSFKAGATRAAAGSAAPFALGIVKPDGNAALNGLRMELPQGLLANLKGNVGSQIGSVKAYAGPGSSPFMLPGKVFLEGRYGDAPFSLRAVVPAKAGPFDLGEVVVRQRIYVDPEDAHVTVVSDPLPTIVKGVPVRLQRLDVDVDKEGFMVNPTSCVGKEIKATLSAAGGQSAPVTNRFRVSDCSELGFAPRVAMRVKGKRQLKTGGHPALRAVVTQANGQANIGRAQVTLPRSIVLDAVNSFDPKLVCDYDRALKADCPESSVIGRAVARTPLLNRPLAGGVHLVQGIKFGPTGNRIRTTPSLLVKLRGEVAIDLRAKTTVKDDRLVTTFANVPDAPVSKFSMTVAGGKKGILVVTRTRRAKIDLCKSRQIANVDTTGHNGKKAAFATRVKTPCGAHKKAARAHQRAAGRRASAR